MAFEFITRWARIAALVPCMIVVAPLALAQPPDTSPPDAPAPVIETAVPEAADSAIETRIAAIFAEIDSLNAVTAEVRQGVVTLQGEVANNAAAVRAEEMALRVQGVVTVEDRIERTLAVQDNVAPFFASASDRLRNIYRALPLYGVALAVFLLIAFVGHLLASWKAFWRRILPNPFLSELVASAVRVAMIIVGLVAAISFLGATALMGTILGGAGVIGIALGFSLRDTLENYISSIMLSVRQPFRANEHVVIGDQEGKVVRLTSRSTVLMTLDGNHLRIPNATVFKAVILNYTRNPERRFEFDLGIDAADDPVAAMQLGLDRLKILPFVLAKPEPEAFIGAVGDSSIVLRFMAWVHQGETHFCKARGLAINATKDVLEAAGFTLPEPIYRLRFDTGSGQAPDLGGAAKAAQPDKTPQPRKAPPLNK
ncbi:MAG: mechanosensitive ion channel family protein, partial [Pseudohongiellaceae bacterium]